jgi:hypothetical protein
MVGSSSGLDRRSFLIGSIAAAGGVVFGPYAFARAGTL